MSEPDATCATCGGKGWVGSGDPTPPPCPQCRPDPRVKTPGGPHPNIAAVKALAENVHARMDGLGVPRATADGEDEFTLLGRVAGLLDLLSAVEVEMKVVHIDETWVSFAFPDGRLATAGKGDTVKVPQLVVLRP